MDTDDTLLEQKIRDGLATKYIGQTMLLLPTVHSTNQYLQELDTAVVDDGFVVMAEEQTGGRGRKGRAFLSPKREGVYFSILLKLDVRPDTRFLTICAAVAVSKAIEKVCGIRAEIKWVNDIFCNGKKVCGILAEAVVSAEAQALSAVIVGIGINTGSVPCALGDIATSIREATGMRGIRNQLIAEVLNQFEAVYLGHTESKSRQEMISYYQSRLFIVGKRVWTTGTARDFVATVRGIDDTGALIVQDDGGEIHHISTGEITLIGGK